MPEEKQPYSLLIKIVSNGYLVEYQYATIGGSFTREYIARDRVEIEEILSEVLADEARARKKA